MDVPNALRGYRYPTSKIARCPSFSRCRACSACQNYDPHQHECIICESRKPESNICSLERHSDHTQWCFIELERKFGKPLYHPDNKSYSAEIPISDDTEAEKLLKGISEYNRYGNIDTSDLK
jgi:recombinational DNA repair protein RecR